MGFFDFLKQPDINRGVANFRNTEGAVLVDVRTPQEFREGHIPGSKNVPLQQLDKISAVTDNNTDIIPAGADARIHPCRDVTNNTLHYRIPPYFDLSG